MNYLQNKYNIFRHFSKTSLHYCVKYKSLKMFPLLYQFLMINLCRTFMITLWMLTDLKNTFYEFGDIALLRQWPYIQ